jgi:hypothetical protein
MGINQYLFIILLLILGGCGYILWLIVKEIQLNSRGIATLNETLQDVIGEVSGGVQRAERKLDQLDLLSDVSQSVRDFSKVIENIRIPVIRLETHPFKVNITKDIQARWILTRQEKIKMVEQQMMTAEQLFEYREKLQQEYLAADRMAKKDDAILLKAKIEAVETVMGVKL